MYKVPFHPSNLTPMLLGLAVWVGRYDWHVSTLAWRMRMQLALPFAAVALSAISLAGKMPESPLAFEILGIWFTPLRLALLGASAVYLDGWFIHRHAYFAVGSAVYLAGAGLGSSVREMSNNTVDFTNYWLDAIRGMVPTTSSQWGVLSVIGAFVLLAMGAALSLLREPPSEDADEARSG